MRESSDLHARMRSAFGEVAEAIIVVSPMKPITYGDTKLANVLRLSMAIRNSNRFRNSPGGIMSGMIVLLKKWNACYRILRRHSSFSVVDSIRHGLWLAQG